VKPAAVHRWERSGEEKARCEIEAFDPSRFSNDLEDDAKNTVIFTVFYLAFLRGNISLKFLGSKPQLC
jgi:hypothetical protein